MDKRKTIIPIIIVVLVVLAFFFLKSPKKQENATENTELESFSTEEEEKETLSVSVIDNTESYSKREQEIIKGNADSFLTEVLKAYYTFDYTDTEKESYVSGIKSLFDTDSKWYKRRISGLYKSLKDTETISSYKDHTLGSVVILDEEEMKVEINCLVHVDYQNTSLEAGEYDILVNVILLQEDDVWMIYDINPSYLYTGGTAAFYESEVTGNIKVKGDELGCFEDEETDEEILEDGTANKDDTVRGDVDLEETK